MYDVLITGGVGIVSGALSGFISWFFTRKKYNAEVQSNEIQNMDSALDFYKKFIDDVNVRFDDVVQRNNLLQKQNEELKANNEQLKDDISELRKQMLELSLKICLRLSCTKRITGVECTEVDRYKDLEKD